MILFLTKQPFTMRGRQLERCRLIIHMFYVFFFFQCFKPNCHLFYISPQEEKKKEKAFFIISRWLKTTHMWVMEGNQIYALVQIQVHFHGWLLVQMWLIEFPGKIFLRFTASHTYRRVFEPLSRAGLAVRQTKPLGSQSNGYL